MAEWWSLVVLKGSLASQVGVHEEWGGVVPKLAQQSHRAAIDGTVAEALRRAAVSPADLSAVAVTVGPGLAPYLDVAKEEDVDDSSSTRQHTRRRRRSAWTWGCARRSPSAASTASLSCALRPPPRRRCGPRLFTPHLS